MEYLSPPLTNFTFYLLKLAVEQDDYCQELYSFQHSLEQFVIPNATIPDTSVIGKQNGSDVVFKFCKYTPGSCYGNSIQIKRVGTLYSDNTILRQT